MSRLRQRSVPYLLVLAAGVLALTFVVVPIVFVVVLAFFDVNLIAGAGTYVGLGNFRTEIANDEFVRGLRNTVVYGVLTVIPSMTLGLGVALLVNGLARGKGFWRSVYFLPVATTLVAMSAVWRWMFRADTGIVDTVLSPLLGMHDWLADPDLALGAIAIVGNWHQIGLVAILYLAALGSLPGAQFDSARIDGATSWSVFRHVTWPALGPTTIFAFITTVGSALQAYDIIAAMTQGGPAGSTETLTYMIWVRGVNYFDIGRAAVLSVTLLALSLLVTAAQRTRYARRLEEGGSR